MLFCRTTESEWNISQNFMTARAFLPERHSAMVLIYYVCGSVCLRLSMGNPYKTRRSVEHCTPHTDGAWLNELGWSQ